MIKNDPAVIQDKLSSSMRFQERDGELLLAIYQNDGVLSRRQLKTLFWPDKSTRAEEKRLAKLKHARYITWPTPLERRIRPIPEPIVWLDWMGIAYVAGSCGVSIPLLKKENENELRRMEKALRDKGIHWVREPRWTKLTHDLAIVDFRLNIEKAVRLFPSLSLEEWINESEFHSKPDTVEYEVEKTDGSRKKLSHQVIPDGYFILSADLNHGQGIAGRARFLLEIDMATHDNPSFGREKVIPGYVYLLSEAYRRRFGDNSGRWLIVTTGERRLQHMKRQAESETSGAASAFYFTTFDRVKPETVLTAPIWQQGGKDNFVPLLTSDHTP